MPRHVSAEAKRAYACKLHKIRQAERRSHRVFKTVVIQSSKRRLFDDIHRARHECHRVFDRLWAGPDAPMVRKHAYKYLQDALRLPAHWAHIRHLTIRQCNVLIRQVREDYPELFGEEIEGEVLIPG